MTEPLKGRCFCGAVAYQAEGLSSPIGYCHCETCQKIHAAAFVPTAGTSYDGFKWTKGKDTVASIESSPGKLRYFCPKCGTHLVAEVIAEKRLILRIGSADTPDIGKAVIHIWTDHQADYFEFDDRLPRQPEGARKSK